MSSNRALNVVASIALGLVTALPAQAAIRWAPDLATAQQVAAEHNRLVLVHFWGPSCGPCRTLEANVFSQPYVGDAILANYIPVKIDGSRNPEIAKRFGVRSWPTDVIITPDGQVVRAVGCPQDPQQYIGQLRAIAAQMPATRQDTFPRQGSPTTDFASSNTTAYGRGPGGPVDQRQYPSDPRGTSFAPTSRETYNPYATQRYPDALRNLQGSAGASGQPTGNFGYDPSGYGGQPNGATPGPGNRPLGTNPGQYGGPTTPPADPAHGAGGGTLPPGRQIESYDPYAAGPSARGGPPDASPTAPRGMGAAGPDMGQTPTGTGQNPPLGFDGHCPVTLKTSNKWEKGNPQFGAIHRGRTYLFVGRQQQQQFMARPDEFSPVLSGNDAVEFVDNGRLVPGSRHHGLEYDGLMYLFVSEESLQKFARMPKPYAISVYQAMQVEPGQRSTNNAGPGNRPY